MKEKKSLLEILENFVMGVSIVIVIILVILFVRYLVLLKDTDNYIYSKVTIIETGILDNMSDEYHIIYDKETKIKYFYLSTDCSAVFTPLYNADGSVQFFDEKTQQTDNCFTVIDSYTLDSMRVEPIECIIMYANDSKVEYLLTYNYHSGGRYYRGPLKKANFTPLYDENGNLQIYDE